MSTNFKIDTTSSLHKIKRQIYLYALLIGVLAILITWLLKISAQTANGYDYFIFPILAFIYISLLVFLLKDPKALLNVEVVIFTSTGLSLLGRLFDILFNISSLSTFNTLIALSDLLYWFPLVYVLGFLIFETRRLLIISALTFFSAIVILGFSYIYINWATIDNIPHFYLIIRFIFANAIYITLLILSARLNEQYIYINTLAGLMKEMAHTDSLIQIANRRELEEKITLEIINTNTHHTPLSLIMFDLDDFKKTNDTHGHDYGDTVLIEISQSVQKCLRTTDLLGRWGGEEFLIIATKTSLSQSLKIAERIRKAISNTKLKHGNITASFGVTTYRLGESSADWLKRTDDSMYFAKKNGKNQVSSTS